MYREFARGNVGQLKGGENAIRRWSKKKTGGRLARIPLCIILSAGPCLGGKDWEIRVLLGSWKKRGEGGNLSHNQCWSKLPADTKKPTQTRGLEKLEREIEA